jgi:hypothetical protein
MRFVNQVKTFAELLETFKKARQGKSMMARRQ